MSKTLVTGGAGFIGSQLAKRLAEGGHATVVLDDLSTGRRENLDGVDSEFQQGSILDADVLDRAMAGVDRVIHLAAIPSVPRSVADPVSSHEANASGTLAVLESARRHSVRHVTVASSSSVYGANQELPKKERSWLAPMSPYAVSKLATEAYTSAYGYSYGMRTIAFRFFNVYGPGQSADHAYAAVIPKFVDAALTGQPLVIEGDGTQTRDFTYVDTVCAALTRASMEEVCSAVPVNLAFGTRTSIIELVDHLGQLLGRSLNTRFTDARVGDVPHSQADGTTMRLLLGDLEPVELVEGLRRTVAWFKR